FRAEAAPVPAPAPLHDQVALGCFACLPDVGLADRLGERPARLPGSRTGLQHDALTGEGVLAHPGPPGLDLAPGQGADHGEAHPLSLRARPDRLLEDVLNGMAQVRLLDLQALLGDLLM